MQYLSQIVRELGLEVHRPKRREVRALASRPGSQAEVEEQLVQVRVVAAIAVTS
jgi:hypothetical protein